jgi:light-regulated signal transduction histidine kinase (bacteriophytochrome)
MVPVSLDHVVAQAQENLTIAIEQSGAAVEVGPMPTVLGDETQLVQLFQNLFDNAIKFRGATPPKVSVSCHDTGNKWEFAVQDNGIGIDPKYHDRIFRLFQRLHTQEEYSGTGIGLAVCKKIVERHGGAIRVEPAEGGGSVFRFTLPKKGEAEAKVEVKPEEPGTKNQEPGTKE